MKYCLVTQRIEKVLPDVPGPEDEVSGKVRFAPSISYGGSFQVETGDGMVTVPAAPVEAEIVAGVLTHGGEPGVRLFAGGENSNPREVVWTAIYQDMSVRGHRIHLEAVTFVAVPGGVVDLTAVTPVAGSPRPGITRGEKGDPGLPGEPGPEGPQGLIPTIGENGNWWIGDEDTGVPASGGGGGTGLPSVETFPVDLDTYSISLEAAGMDDWPWELTNDGYKFDVTPQAQGGFAGFAVEYPRSEIAHLATEDGYVDFEVAFKGDEQLLGESVNIILQGVDAEGNTLYGGGKASHVYSAPTFTDCSWTREHFSLWAPDDVDKVQVLVFSNYLGDKPARLEVAEMAFRPGKNRTQYPPQSHKHTMDEAGLSILRGSNGITAEYRDEYNDRIILFGDTGQRRLDVEQGWESENGLIIRRINFTVSLHGEVTYRGGGTIEVARYPQRALKLGRTLSGVAYGKDDPSHIRHFTFYEDTRGHVRIDNPEPDVTYVIDQTWQVNPAAGHLNGPWATSLPGTPGGNSYWALEDGD